MDFFSMKFCGWVGCGQGTIDYILVAMRITILDPWFLDLDHHPDLEINLQLRFL